MEQIESLSYQIQYNVKIRWNFRARTDQLAFRDPIKDVRHPIEDVRRLEDEFLLTDLEICELKALLTRHKELISSNKKIHIMVGVVGLLVLFTVTTTHCFF
ncbi:unnamed protein product [Cochlearia groenlandica]